jgi:hypothetical protein
MLLAADATSHHRELIANRAQDGDGIGVITVPRDPAAHTALR